MKYYQRERHLLASIYNVIKAYANIQSSADYYKADNLKGHSLKQINDYIQRYIPWLSEDAKAILSPDKKLSRSLSLLEVYYNQQAEAEKARQCKWEETAAAFSPLTQKALNMIDPYEPYLILDETSKRCTIHSSEAFDLSIYFDNAQLPQHCEELFVDNLELVDDQGMYQLNFTQEDESTAEIKEFSMPFSDCRAVATLYDYFDNLYFHSGPWNKLARCLYALEQKHGVLGAEYCSDDELKLLPLCSFTPLTSMYIPGTDDSCNTEAEAFFKELALKAGCTALTELTDKYIHAEPKQRRSAAAKIQNALKLKSNEPLYRLIADMAASAAGIYPKATQGFADKLQPVRDTITAVLHGQGFEGNYPHFRKLSEFKGLHIININVLPYIIHNERHMASFIDCTEGASYGTGGFTLATGTVFLKKDELSMQEYEHMDADSAFFDDKGRRRAKIITVDYDLHNENKEETVTKTALTAAKAAQCMKLDAVERKSIHQDNLSGNVLLFIMWLIVGAVFGLLMIVAMLLISLFIILILTGSLSDAGKLILSAPWGSLFLFSWLAFGISMFILTLLGKRRG